MANIAVQRIKREFKEVLKSEEVGCHVLPVNVPAFLFPLFDCEAESEWRVAGSAVSFLIIKLLALANWTASDTTVRPASQIWTGARQS